MKRATALILALALALTLLPAGALAASSPAFGEEVWLKDTLLQEGVVLSENIFWSPDYNKPRHEYYITYSPGVGSDLPSAAGASAWGQPGVPDIDLSWLFPDQDPDEEPGQPEEDHTGLDRTEPDQAAAPSGEDAVYTGIRPVASYGNSVCGRSTVSAAAQAYESQGYRVVGAINGDFYDTATGYPLGILISGGEVLSGSSEYYAVGFRPDGSAVMGSPQLAITAHAGGRSLKLASVNKPRVNKAGVTMLTYDYRDDHTTGSSVASQGVNVLASVVGGRASIGGELFLQVEEVAEDDQVRTLRADQVLLTGGAEGYTEGLDFLRSLKPGDPLSITYTTPDPAWNEVTEAIGAYYLLVENGTAKDFEVSAAPRTAIGVKANGDVVLYTLDGRQDSHSMGSSLGVLAKRMVELGCVTALCLDGGGSTTAVAATPDSVSAKLLNSPSDKTQRSVSNHLLLLAPGEATGVPGGVTLSAGAPAVLTGHTVTLSANVTDTHYFPISSLPVALTATAGEVTDGVFTAPRQSGRVTVFASYEGFTAQRDVLVVNAPETLTIRADGAASLTAQPGDTVRLTASGTYRHLPLEVSPEDLTWTVDPSLGTIDEHGVFTAANHAGTGTITATLGGVSARLQVTVEAGHPFVDIDGHPLEAYMAQLYREGVLAGETGEDGKLYARPERGVSRAEFSVLLARYLKLNTADYANTATPFEDLGGVESWAGDAIRAMYALGIVGGMDPTHFAPQGALERAQAVAMLGRALKLTEDGQQPVPEEPAEPNTAEPDGSGAQEDPEAVPGEGEPVLPEEPALPEEAGQLLSAAGDSLAEYSDADAIPEYALDYFRILVSLGAVSGTDGKLSPRAPMTRADICKALVVLRDAQ